MYPLPPCRSPARSLAPRLPAAGAASSRSLRRRFSRSSWPEALRSEPRLRSLAAASLLLSFTSFASLTTNAELDLCSLPSLLSLASLITTVDTLCSRPSLESLLSLWPSSRTLDRFAADSSFSAAATRSRSRSLSRSRLSEGTAAPFSELSMVLPSLVLPSLAFAPELLFRPLSSAAFSACLSGAFSGAFSTQRSRCVLSLTAMDAAKVLRSEYSSLSRIDSMAFKIGLAYFSTSGKASYDWLSRSKVFLLSIQSSESKPALSAL
mmetsp:Transcript_43614/g.110438  ORF Transcript_43614/g.110438 Transcript_43614/m.110438 type:complete len:265 (+) Transcript_43614:272-1066(+)